MSVKPLEPVCGIDLGTTNSCIAIVETGAPEVIDIHGHSTMPSVVASKDGEWLVGKAAYNHLWVAPEDAVASIKRKMDDPQYRVNIGGEELSPIDISAKILRAMVQSAEQETQLRLRNVVITVPAWFQETQRQATLAAGRQADLNVIQIINEPTAAAIAHQNVPIAEDREEKWLVYDLGGGTFDVSVMNVTSASYEVLASTGNTFLGGDDFDHRLAEKFITYLRDQHNIDPNSDSVAQTRLRLLAEQTKVRLSDEPQVRLSEPIPIGSQTYLLDCTITREDFEDLIDDLISSTEEKAAQALSEAAVDAKSLDRLLLVGGSTRIPLIANRLQSRFGIAPENWLNPDLSVAIGASLRAAIASDRYFERSIVDICPHSLGIAALGELDYLLDINDADITNTHPLTFAALIRRNSRLPAEFTRTFYKLEDKQKRVEIMVYQGESANTRENTFIGSFFAELKNHLDSKLDVCFAYDVNGTIRISVLETGSQEANRVFTMDLNRPSEENSDDNVFSEHIAEPNLVDSSSDDEPLITNYLVEKISHQLEEETDVSEEIIDLLAEYKQLLSQDAEGELDDTEKMDAIEDQLYDWIESRS